MHVCAHARACVSAGAGSESVCGQARGRASFGASRQATEMHSFQEKLDPSDVNGTMDYGLWPLAFGLWPLAFGLLVRLVFETFPTRFHIRIQFTYIHMCSQMCFLYKEL